MADDFDSDTGVGFKRRISDISDTEVEPRTFEEPHSAPLSPHQQSPAIGSDCDLESFNNGLQKKAKCSSHQDNQETVEEDKLDCGNDVAMKLSDDKIDADENDSGFCGIEESGEVNKNVVNSAVEDCNKGLADSCTSFDENVSESSFENKKDHFLVESGLESISDSRSHIVKFTDENLGVIEGKGKHKMSCNDSQNQRACVRDVRCALKIQVIDDTALIGSVSASASRVVANHNVNKKNKKNQETDFGNEKKSRRRGKALKNCSGTNGNGKVLFTQMVEVDSQKGCEKKGDVNVEEQKKKWVYSRKEMEDLRFVNVEEQKKKWVEIHCGFGPVVRKEYDGLIDANHQKHIRVNFDPRPLLRKKDAGPPILSDEYFENMDNEIQSMNSLDPACGPSDSVLDGDAVVQEEFSEDDDSDEEYSSIQRPAFLVTGKPDFDSGPPLDGLEYLRRVRWEAEHIPKVKVAKVERRKLNKEQTIYMPKIPDIAKCPDHLLPLKQWEDAFLADFSELRLALSRYEGSCAKVSVEPQSLPAVHEQEYPNLLLDTIVLEKFENLTTDEVESSQSVDSSIQSLTVNEMDDSLSLSSPKSFLGDCGPTLSTILGMDSVARVSMLRKRISSVETMSSLSRNDCVWLFALCAAVDTPLNADTCASLRCLLRKCASLRAEKVEMDDEVVMLNILATVSGKYFGQSEN